jgi:hypothetical protein
MNTNYEKHDAAIAKLYFDNGVGATTNQKLRFWNTREGNCNFSHNPTDEQRVVMREISWLGDQFPGEFIEC